MRILVYGAGVIGSLYAVLFSKAGYDVTVFARGRRLAQLEERGLLYREGDKVARADVRVLARLADDDVYDYVLLAVRCEQAGEALRQLAANSSPTIVTMINTSTSYAEWERLCGKGRILPAFPGAGGGIHDGVLDASLTPGIVQLTTFGEIDGRQTERLKALEGVFRRSRVPYQVVPDMRNWQLCHLGLVVPLSDAYARSAVPAHVWRDRGLMRRCASELKANMRFFERRGQLSPGRLRWILVCPLPLMTWVLARIYHSEFGNRFMYQHEMKAGDEMLGLHDALYRYMEKHRQP